jgi:hypothetical protein
MADAPAAAALAAPPAAVPPALDVRQSIEPTADRDARVAEPAGGAQLAWVTAVLRRHSRLAVIGVMVGSGLLFGLIIGYSVAQRRPATAARDAVDRDRDSLVGNPGRSATGVRESVSAGGIAPLPDATRRAPRDQTRGAGRSEQRSPNRMAPRVSAGRASGGRAPSTAPIVAPQPGAVAPANPPAAITMPDAAAVRARRDSVIRAESLAAERESIRREIEMRRARLDSIERARRRLDSLQRATPRPSPPR